MDTRHVQDKPVPEYLELAAGKAVTVPGGRGTVVRSLEGEVWVTRDGDAQDYFVPPGASYNAGSSGSIVVSAIAGHSQVAVYRVPPQPAGLWSQNSVQFEPASIDAIRQAAQQARAEHIAALVRSTWHHVQRAWRRLMKSRNSAETPPLRARGYNG